MTKVILDADTFKALASPTRLAVLRALDERRRTVTELARHLELNKATVHEHLQLLVACGLVRKRDDEGRKWIYYELTWRGQRILHPQETTSFMVLLGLSVAAAGGGVLLLGRALGWWLQEQALTAEDEPFGTFGDPQAADASEERQGSPNDSEEPPDAPAEGTQEPLMDSMDPDGWIGIALFLCAMMLTGLAVLIRRTAKRSSAKENGRDLKE